jgi:hypothetical protein
MNKWHIGGAVKPLLLLFIIIFCCCLPFICPTQAQAQGEYIKLIAEVLEVPAPTDIIAIIERVQEDPTGELKKGDRIFIDAWGYYDENSDIDWPLQTGDKIEVYGKGGIGPGPGGTVASIGVGILPQYLRKITDQFILAVSVVPQGSGDVVLTPRGLWETPKGHVYDKGTVVTLDAIHRKGWEFDQWDGVDHADWATATVTMNSDRDVTAYFKKEGGDGDGKVPAWRKDIQKGDILLHRKEGVLACLFEWTHAGIYVGDDWVVEARREGISKYPISDWDEPNDTWVVLLRVYGSETRREEAAKWALGQTERQPKPTYWLHLLGKDPSPDSVTWYCSELVWAAYYNLTPKVDLGYPSDVPLPSDYLDFWPVPPGHGLGWEQGRICWCLSDDDNVHEIGRHTSGERPKCKFGILVKAKSPVDLAVTDPYGLTISKDKDAILGAAYVQFPFTENSSPEDIVITPELKFGEYLIDVVPEPGASPTDTYSLEVSTVEETIVLAQDVKISDIPGQPYKIKSTPSGIYPADEDDDQNIPPSGWFSTNGPLLLVVLALAAVVIFALVTRKPAPVPVGRGRVGKAGNTVVVGRRTTIKPGETRWFGTRPWIVILGCCVVFILLFVPIFPITKTIEVTETTFTTVIREKPETVETEQVVKVYTGWMRDSHGNTQRVDYSDEVVDVQYVRAPNNKWDISLIDRNGKERIYRDVSEYDLTKTASITIPVTRTKNVAVTETVPQKLTREQTVQLRVNLIQLIFGGY